MSTFKTAYDKSVEFQRIGNDMHLNITYKNGGNAYNVILDPADAPEIALAVLAAAGHNIAAGPRSEEPEPIEQARWYLNKHIEKAEAKAAAAAEEAARGKRRDELAREFTGLSWSAIGAGAVTLLINTLIDTENELAKERAK